MRRYACDTDAQYADVLYADVLYAEAYARERLGELRLSATCYDLADRLRAACYLVQAKGEYEEKACLDKGTGVALKTAKA